ncbi:MAG: choice-of-anchor D domain-containing protein, partial [Verrucomicrobiae bacterium]|nr:choice-of-anchor D domain-containing protein [Verrucomicrobiae bacterium]
MKRFVLIVLSCLFLAGTLRATVSVEFQLGAVDLPSGSLGILVADTSGNGFTHPSAAIGTALSPGEALAGSDDIVVAVFSVGELADWGGARGFASLLPPINYDALGVAEGQSLIFYAFPARSEGDPIRQDEPVIAYRPSEAGELSGDMDFALPADGGAYQLAALASNQGGLADLADFGSPAPDIAVAIDGGASIGNGGTVNFGDVLPAETASQTLRIANVGIQPLTGLALTTGGSDLDQYQIAPFVTTELAPGESVLLSVQFSPTELGVHQASLQFASNDPDENPFVVQLRGNLDRRFGKPIDDPDSPGTDPDANSIDDWTTDWDAANSAIYDGLLLDDTDHTTLLGAIGRLLVTKPKVGSPNGGGVSGTVRLKGRSAAIKGSFDSQGRFARDFPQKDGTILSVDLQLMETAAGHETIRGTVAWDGVVAEADLPRAPFNASTNPVDPSLAGPYTLILPSQPDWGDNEPGGDGWATARLYPGGMITVSGVLGDGVKFAETAYLSGEAEARLYTEPYRSVPERGRFGGKIVFRNEASSDFDGMMQWKKFPAPRDARYKAGFDLEVWALGSHYTPPAKGERVLPQLADQHYNAEVTFIGPTAPNPGGGGIDRAISWKSNNKLVHYGPEKLGATALAKTGTLAGSFFDPATKTKVAFTGVAFQKQGLAAGTFLNGPASGAVRILPGTAFTYPGSEDAGPLTRIEPPGSPTDDPAETQPDPLADGVLPAAAGLYGGVLFSSLDGTTPIGALEGVKLAPTGAISGTLWFEGVRFGFKGNLLLDGGVIHILRKNEATLDLTLHLTQNV